MKDVSFVSKSDQDFKTTWLGEYALNGSVEASIFVFAENGKVYQACEIKADG